MKTLESLTLGGCAPTPLASYLKAIGVLRLISSDANHVGGQAADPKARGWWENERFRLKTALDRDALCRFFLEEYAPSPIVAPWNGASGFYPKDNKDGFGPLSSEIVAKRFIPMAKTIEVASHVVARRELTQSPKEKDKIEFVSTLRAELPDEALGWLDAALSLSGDKLSYPQLLGTGGNDGHLDFTNNFMRRLVSGKRPSGLFDATSGRPSDDAPSLLSNALFDTPVKGLDSAAVGQFAPGAAGGPNATAGYEGDGNVNPWDFVLMLEGAICFAGAATRRHQGAAQPGASFPFTTRSVGAGWGGVDAADENDARAEFWAPLWQRPARSREIDALLVEGRAVLNGRTARNGLDFARAVSSLGTSRGFSEFERYGFLMRAGRAYLATPVGRRPATPSLAARLVADLDTGDWLDRVRWTGRSDGEPAAARNAVKRLEDALFELAADTSSPAIRTQRTLVALGEICKWLAVSRKGREAVGAPPPAMSEDWIRRADDGSPEFRVAAALAGLGLPPIGRRDSGETEVAPESRPENRNAADDGTGDRKTSPAWSRSALPMAAHFAPIAEFCDGRRRHAWSSGEAPPSVVWGAGGLVSNMIAVLERRLVEGAMRGLEDKPLAGAVHARLADVGAFLSGDFDDGRCAALLAGMIWVRPAWLRRKASADADAPPVPVPFAYAALKPLFTPDRTLHRIRALAETARMPIPPGLVARLRAGGGNRDGRAADAAVRAALTRARASGLPSPFESGRAGGRRPGAEGGRIGAGLRADRLAAALLIPIDDRALKMLVERAYPGTLAEVEEHVESAEDANDAA